jgi:hypothetical protein
MLRESHKGASVLCNLIKKKMFGERLTLDNTMVEDEATLIGVGQNPVMLLMCPDLLVNNIDVNRLVICLLYILRF